MSRILLGRSLAHDEGVALVSEWIEQLEGGCYTSSAFVSDVVSGGFRIINANKIPASNKIHIGMASNI